MNISTFCGAFVGCGACHCAVWNVVGVGAAPASCCHGLREFCARDAENAEAMTRQDAAGTDGRQEKAGLATDAEKDFALATHSRLGIDGAHL
jgi:hypothetical protein